MAYKKNFNSYSFDQYDRKTLYVSSFGGVDLSNQKFNVSSSRAIQSKNFVYRDGFIQKRFGYEQILQAENKQYKNENDKLISNTNNFNGIWKFTAEDKKEHIVAHIGKFLFEILNINNINIELKLLKLGLENNKSYELLDNKSFAFVSGEKLWILGGINYLCVRFQANKDISIYKVEEMEENFIPTTTMSIVETYSVLTSGIRVNYQPVNLLNKYRKNACITGQARNSDSNYVGVFYEYVLDAPIVLENDEDMVDFKITLEIPLESGK